MNYRSVADLDDQIVGWLPRLPRDLDVVVGVPRSGLLAANLVALHLNLPLTDVEGLLHGRLLQTGKRLNVGDGQSFLAQPRRVLVVDDSVLSGKALAAVREALRAAGSHHHVRYAAPYVVPGSEHLVDYHAELLPAPRCFEWNLMHHKLFLANTCMDIDGVLCRDPKESENDDGPGYQEFVKNADPLYLPSHPVRWLVTSRLEKYRAATEDWLRRHGIEYGELRMMNYPDMSARRSAGAYASFKANIYVETGAWMFIESHRELSKQIAVLSGRDVFCMDTREMIGPEEGKYRARRLFDQSTPLGIRMLSTYRKVRRLRRAWTRRVVGVLRGRRDAEARL